MIDTASFTPLGALAGGLLIGLASTIFILFNGRSAGISGILGGLLRPARGDIGWRVAFLAGIIGAPLVYSFFAPVPEVQIDADTVTLVAAGLLVGAGTRYASGCTSGHGVCGVSRMSPRSLVATGIFMVAGFATVFIVRHVFA